MKRLSTLVLYHPLMVREGYPVLAGRLQPAFDYLSETNTLRASQVVLEEAQPVEEELLRQVHSAKHIAEVGRTTYDRAARLSGGAAVQAGVAVWQRRARNAFVFTGCAGHHASRDSAWGFCYYNNEALLVRHLQRTLAVERFLLVDTDPHFGDGTRDILGDDAGVWHLNFFGSYDEGARPASVHQVDVPLPVNVGDRAFVEALSRLAPILAQRSHAQMLVWNMGHDAHADDYGSFQLSLRAFPAMTRVLLHVAAEYCDDRLVVLLSGGGEVFVARHAISSIVRLLAGLPDLPADVEEQPSPISAIAEGTAKKNVDAIMGALGSGG
jgi:acetoin utilization deacetylase AcuC-like enzyme